MNFLDFFCFFFATMIVSNILVSIGLKLFYGEKLVSITHNFFNIPFWAKRIIVFPIVYLNYMAFGPLGLIFSFWIGMWILDKMFEWHEN
jgi:hypothetical protein